MEIRIGKSARRCCASGKGFVHGDEIVSLIRYREREFVREDYCKSAYAAEQGRGAVAVWSSRYIDPDEEERQAPEVFSPLRQVFYQSASSNTRPELAIAYLAAQLLRRQKVFRQIRGTLSEEDGARVSIFIDRINNRLVEVRDPDLTYDELSTARHDLLERLKILEEAPHDEPG